MNKSWKYTLCEYLHFLRGLFRKLLSASYIGHAIMLSYEDKSVYDAGRRQTGGGA